MRPVIRSDCPTQGRPGVHVNGRVVRVRGCLEYHVEIEVSHFLLEDGRDDDSDGVRRRKGMGGKEGKKDENQENRLRRQIIRKGREVGGKERTRPRTHANGDGDKGGEIQGQLSSCREKGQD